jgi:hypothetical protein
VPAESDFGSSWCRAESAGQGDLGRDLEGAREQEPREAGLVFYGQCRTSGKGQLSQVVRSSRRFNSQRPDSIFSRSNLSNTDERPRLTNSSIRRSRSSLCPPAGSARGGGKSERSPGATIWNPRLLRASAQRLAPVEPRGRHSRHPVPAEKRRTGRRPERRFRFLRHRPPTHE